MTIRAIGREISHTSNDMTGHTTRRSRRGCEAEDDRQLEKKLEAFLRLHAVSGLRGSSMVAGKWLSNLRMPICGQFPPPNKYPFSAGSLFSHIVAIREGRTIPPNK